MFSEQGQGKNKQMFVVNMRSVKIYRSVPFDIFKVATMQGRMQAFIITSASELTYSYVFLILFIDRMLHYNCALNVIFNLVYQSMGNFNIFW